MQLKNMVFNIIKMFPIITIAVAVFYFSATWAIVPKHVPVKRFGARIFNGEEAQLGQFPWQVAIIGRSTTFPRYLCGGALISDQWVLTAGHCVVGAISATIYSATTKISDDNKTTSEAAEFIVHQYFEAVHLNHDIGLIRLKTPLTINDNTQPINLAEEELDEHANVTLSGWGIVSDDDLNPYSDSLRFTNVSFISNMECEAIYGYQTVIPGVVCTDSEYPLRGPCLGDSGGPVVANANTDPVHVAIFSFINKMGCETSYPAGNTRTAYYRDWIKAFAGV